MSPWFEFGKVGTCRLALRPGLLTGPCVRATLFWSWQPDYCRPPGNLTLIFTGRRGPSEEPRIKSPLVLNLFSLSFFSYPHPSRWRSAGSGFWSLCYPVDIDTSMIFPSFGHGVHVFSSAFVSQISLLPSPLSLRRCHSLRPFAH